MLHNPTRTSAARSGFGYLLGDTCVLSPRALAALGNDKLNSLGARCGKIGTEMLSALSAELRIMSPLRLRGNTCKVVKVVSCMKVKLRKQCPEVRAYFNTYLISA